MDNDISWFYHELWLGRWIHEASDTSSGALKKQDMLSLWPSCERTLDTSDERFCLGNKDCNPVSEAASDWTLALIKTVRGDELLEAVNTALKWKPRE